MITQECQMPEDPSGQKSFLVDFVSFRTETTLMSLWVYNFNKTQFESKQELREKLSEHHGSVPPNNVISILSF